MTDLPRVTELEIEILTQAVGIPSLLCFSLHLDAFQRIWWHLEDKGIRLSGRRCVRTCMRRWIIRSGKSAQERGKWKH